MKKILLIIAGIGFCFLSTAQIQVNKSSGWSLTGNSGTNPALNFIGTNDYEKLRFKVAGQNGGFIDYTDGRTCQGFLAGDSITNTAVDITAFGWGVLARNIVNVGNTGVGTKVQTKNKGDYNTGVGAGVMEECLDCYENTGSGAYSLLQMQHGSGNVTSGRYALANMTTGNYNVAIGWRPMYSSSVCSENTAVGGYGVLFSNTTGSNNAAFASQAGFNNVGSDCLFLGFKAGFEWTGVSSMLAIGNNDNHFLITGNFAAGSIGVGIGQSSPNSTSVFEISSTTKGFLPPRMTTTEKNAISSPAEGLTLYDLTLHQLCYYNGTVWVCN